VNVVVVIGVVNAVVGSVQRQSFYEQRRYLRPEPVVRVPDLQVADDEGVLRVRADAIDAFTEIDAVETRRAVHFVVIEADERQRADIDRLAATIRLLDREDELLRAAGGGLIAEAVVTALGGDVAGERVEAVRPPVTGAFITVEAQDLLGQALRFLGADGQ